MLNPLVFHLRHSIFIYAAPAFALIGVLLVQITSYPQVMTQNNIAEVSLKAIGMLAPLFSGLAAWDGLRERRHGGAQLLETAVQPPARVAFFQMICGSSYAALTAVLIIGSLYVRANWFVLPGQPRWLILALAVVTLVASTAFGYFLAALSKHWGAVIASALSVAALVAQAIFALENGLLYRLNPFAASIGEYPLVPNPDFFTGKLLFLGAILLGMLGALLLVSAGDRIKGLAAMVCAVCLAIPGISSMVKQDSEATRMADDTELVSVQNADGSLTLEIRPNYLPLAAELAERYSFVQQIFAQTPAAFTTLTQNHNGHPEALNGAAPMTDIYLNPASSKVVADSLTESLIDLQLIDCQRRPSSLEHVIVNLWLAGPDSGYSSPLTPEQQAQLDALNALTVSAAREWMSDNYEAYRTCSLTSADMP